MKKGGIGQVQDIYAGWRVVESTNSFRHRFPCRVMLLRRGELSAKAGTPGKLHSPHSSEGHNHIYHYSDWIKRLYINYYLYGYAGFVQSII